MCFRFCFRQNGLRNEVWTETLFSNFSDSLMQRTDVSSLPKITLTGLSHANTC